MSESFVIQTVSEHLLLDLAKLVAEYTFPNICVGAHVKIADFEGDSISGKTGFITEIQPFTEKIFRPEAKTIPRERFYVRLTNNKECFVSRTTDLLPCDCPPGTHSL